MFETFICGKRKAIVLTPAASAPPSRQHSHHQRPAESTPTPGRCYWTASSRRSAETAPSQQTPPSRLCSGSCWLAGQGWTPSAQSLLLQARCRSHCTTTAQRTMFYFNTNHLLSHVIRRRHWLDSVWTDRLTWVVLLRPTWHKIGHFGDVHKHNHLAWYARKINLTTKTCIHQSKETYYNTINTRKPKPDSVAYYDVQPGNTEGLFLFRRFINLSLTYLLRHLPTYSPGTHMGPTNDVLLPVTSYPTWSDDDMGWTAYQTWCKWRSRTTGENSTRLNKLKQ